MNHFFNQLNLAAGYVFSPLLFCNILAAPAYAMEFELSKSLTYFASPSSDHMQVQTQNLIALRNGNYSLGLSDLQFLDADRLSYEIYDDVQVLSSQSAKPKTANLDYLNLRSSQLGYRHQQQSEYGDWTLTAKAHQISAFKQYEARFNVQKADNNTQATGPFSTLGVGNDPIVKDQIEPKGYGFSLDITYDREIGSCRFLAQIDNLFSEIKLSSIRQTHAQLNYSADTDNALISGRTKKSPYRFKIPKDASMAINCSGGGVALLYSSFFNRIAISLAKNLSVFDQPITLTTNLPARSLGVQTHYRGLNLAIESTPSAVDDALSWAASMAYQKNF